MKPDAQNGQASEIEACQWMPRRLLAEQNAKSGSALLQELSTIMEAHLDFEAERENSRAEDSDGAGREEEERENGGSGEDGGGGSGRRCAAAFTAKAIESSRKYGGTSMLYRGSL